MKVDEVTGEVLEGGYTYAEGSLVSHPDAFVQGDVPTTQEVARIVRRYLQAVDDNETAQEAYNVQLQQVIADWRKPLAKYDERVKFWEGWMLRIKDYAEDKLKDKREKSFKFGRLRLGFREKGGKLGFAEGVQPKQVSYSNEKAQMDDFIAWAHRNYPASVKRTLEVMISGIDKAAELPAEYFSKTEKQNEFYWKVEASGETPEED